MDTRYRFVAMLDIMGASKLTKEEPDELGRILLESRDIIREHKYDDMLYFQAYSDSITIVTLNDEADSFEGIVRAAAVLERMFVRNGYAINGAISYGDITIDIENNIFFGNPVVVAHHIQENLFFYGIVLDKKASEKFNNDYPSVFCHGNGQMDSADMIINDIMIPYKKEGWQQTSLINWMDISVFNKGHLVTYEEQVPTMRQLMSQLYEKNVCFPNYGDRANFYILNTELVMKEWYDFSGRKCNRNGWGELIGGKYLFTMENIHNPIELTFDEYVAAMVTIQFKRLRRGFRLQQIQGCLEKEDGDIDMEKVCKWLDEKDYAHIDFSEEGGLYLFAEHDSCLGSNGKKIVNQIF